MYIEKYNNYWITRKREIDEKTSVVFGVYHGDRIPEYPYIIWTRIAGNPVSFENPVSCKTRGEACEAYFQRLEELKPPKEHSDRSEER